MECPICSEKIVFNERSLNRHLEIEPHVIDLIKDLFPRWVRDDGTSPRAVEFYRSMLRDQLGRTDFYNYYKKPIKKFFPYDQL